MRPPHRWTPILVAFFLTCFMTFIVSGISTLRVMGFVPEMLDKWLSNWLFSWAVAFPFATFVLPMVRRLVALIVAPPAGA
jgi:phosphotransferase system  glucose/maltose/N-acetylglucosamine-specific IIC component